MIKIGILAIGEAGSNIGEYAAQKGISVVAVNSAKVDLDKLKFIPKDCRIHLEGWEGAGRNREVGKEAILTHSEAIFEKLNQKFADCDIAFVAASTSGGTGSGGLPVGVEMMLGVTQHVGAITILPDSNESPKALMNALECFSELSQIEQLTSVFVIDNDKAKKTLKDSDKATIYQAANQQVIDNLIEVFSLTTQQSFVSNFDKHDFLEIVSERGCTTISKVIIPIEEIKNSLDISITLKESLDRLYTPNVELSQVLKAAILGKVPKEMTSIIQPSTLWDNETGVPYDIVEAYYPNNEHQNHIILYVVLSGLSFPNERLGEIEKSMQDIEQRLIEKVQTSRQQTFTTHNWSLKFRKMPSSVEEKVSLTERLQKFRT